MSVEEENTKNVSKLFDKHEELHILVATLTENVRHGFEGVHRRQDIANGRLGKLEQNVDKLETTAEAHDRRVEELETINLTHKEVKKEQKKTRRWLKQEVFALFLQAVSTLVLAWVALRLGLR